MRIWDIPVSYLCNKHLVAEHHELHTIYSVVTKNLKGYSRHPETVRWRDRICLLWYRHVDEVAEMLGRGMGHDSPISLLHASNRPGHKLLGTPAPLQSVGEQIALLSARCFDCAGRLALVNP